MTAVMIWVATFLATFALDLCWVYYIRSVEARQPLAAAHWAAFLYLTAAAATVGFVDNPWLLIPATAGAFVGTYVAVQLAQRRERARLE